MKMLDRVMTCSLSNDDYKIPLIVSMVKFSMSFAC